MLDFSHNPWLVVLSLAVALMAGFTGLTLTRGASKRPVPQRKIVVALAAVVLGGGIWSMHFVAMLGLQLPILFYYDALITLVSALLAVLMVGLALLVLHFLPRSAKTILAAGAIIGLGIVVMHSVGMAGMKLCRAVTGSMGLGLTTLASVSLSMLAIWVAYDARTNRNILLGTATFGAAVFTVHFIAIALTSFEATNVAQTAGPLLSHQILGMGVAVAVFLICGGFLLTGVTFLDGPQAPVPDLVPDPDRPQHPVRRAGVPYTKEGHTHFADPAQVAAVRAEGHYTLLYLKDEKLFCPWSITEAEERLAAHDFLRAHRSYLVNPALVSRFERHKDTGTCYFEGTESLPKVPVSRSRLAVVRAALGL